MIVGEILSIDAIVLAAGLSSRFPGNKLLTIVGGFPLIVRTIRNLVVQEKLNRIVVVTGYMREEIENVINTYFEEKIKSGKIRIAYNPLFRNVGMSSSIKVGLSFVDLTADILIMPGDVGCVEENTIRMVLERHVESTLPITIACYKGRHGHPILFKSFLRRELEDINEETYGLKRIINDYLKQINCVETNDKGVIIDIDTLGDVKKCEDLLSKK